MAIKYIKCFNTGSLSDGATKEFTWSPTSDVTIHKILLRERSSTTLDNTQVYIKVTEEVYTLDYAPASIFQGHVNQVPTLDIRVPAKSVVYIKIENHEGAAINVDVVLICT
ncbi:MAG: hypothetical protein J7L38_08655 [Thermoproteales archaeon]|nr:hypothetical protein [Thermoproteales archaeon]